MKRTIFIWDVHGCMSELEALLSVLEYKQKKDKLLFTWDLIHKWPESEEVVRFISSSKWKVYSIMWNHEFKILNDKRFSLHKKFNKNGLLEKIWDFPHWIKWDGFVLTHAGFDPNRKLKEQFGEFDIKNRWKAPSPDWYKSYTWKRKAIYGHWAKHGLRKTKNSIGLDTACVDWGYLTAYILETGEIVQQICMKKWGYTRRSH